MRISKLIACFLLPVLFLAACQNASAPGSAPAGQSTGAPAATATPAMVPVQPTMISAKTLERLPSATSAPVLTVTPDALFGLSPQSIQDYLAIRVGATAFRGKVFCAYQTLGASQSPTSPKLYVWALCQEYYGEKSLSLGSGSSLPVVLFLQMTGSAYQISWFQIPGEGRFVTDVKAFFPETTWDSIFGKDPAAYNDRAQLLEYETAGDALAYFGMPGQETPRPTYTPLR